MLAYLSSSAIAPVCVMAQTSSLRTNEPATSSIRKRKLSLFPATSSPASAPSTPAHLADTYTWPIPTSVKGVWKISDTHHILSSDFALVQRVVDHADRHWALPSELDDIGVYALAALSVAQHPTKAAHWVFWGDKARDATMERCKRVLSAKPRKIYYTGNYPDEFTLAMYHSSGWRKLIHDEVWYASLAAKAPSGPATRKRNRDVIDNSPDASENGDLPPAKRTRATRRMAAAESLRRTATPAPTEPRRQRRATPKALTATHSTLVDPTSANSSTSRQRSNSQTSGTLVTCSSDRSESVLTAVDPSPSPCAGQKDLPLDIVLDNQQRTIPKRMTPPVDIGRPSYRTVKPRSTPPPQKIVQEALAPSKAESQAEIAAKPATRAKRPRAARK